MRLMYAPCPELPLDDAGVAARGGHLEALRWMHAHGLVLDEGVCAAADDTGGGGGGDQRTCAAASGRVGPPLLEWLRDPGARAPPACGAAGPRAPGPRAAQRPANAPP